MHCIYGMTWILSGQNIDRFFDFVKFAVCNPFVLSFISDHFVVQSSRRTLTMVMDGDRNRALHQMMRTCVLEGVRTMYSQTRQRKWQQLQKTAVEILESFGTDGASFPEPRQDPLNNAEVSVGGATTTYTQDMMTDFCQNCRGEWSDA